MMSSMQQYITGYTAANLSRYPIRRRVTFASALESTFIFVKAYTCIYFCLLSSILRLFE